MNAKTIFSYDVRILACQNCGAPINASLEGGQTSCEYCGAVNHVGRRDESRDQRQDSGPTLSESERFQRLRAQDGKPLRPPPSIQHLIAGGALAPQREAQANQLWQQTRAELAQGGAPFPTEERFYFLTFILYEHIGAQNEERRGRAMLETALELLGDQRYRQTIRCMLARNAVRVGDLEAADQWLSPCNPRSDDIHIDTQYRLTTAMIATARGDFSKVTSVLGPQTGDIPIADESDELCSVIRANALERLGDAQLAAQELATSPGVSRHGIGLVEEIARKHAFLDLCPQSLPMARQMLATGGKSNDVLTQLGSNATETKGASLGRVIFGWVFIACGVLFVLIALLGVVLGVLSAVGLPMLTDGEEGSTAFGIGFGVFWIIFAGSFFVMSLGFIVPGWFALKAARKSRRVWDKGVSATAQVLQMSNAGAESSGSARLRLQLLVNLPGKAPYMVTDTSTPPQGASSRVSPGATLPVLVDPDDPSRVVIDWKRV